QVHALCLLEYAARKQHVQYEAADHHHGDRDQDADLDAQVARQKGRRELGGARSGGCRPVGLSGLFSHDQAYFTIKVATSTARITKNSFTRPPSTTAGSDLISPGSA